MGVVQLKFTSRQIDGDGNTEPLLYHRSYNVNSGAWSAWEKVGGTPIEDEVATVLNTLTASQAERLKTFAVGETQWLNVTSTKVQHPFGGSYYGLNIQLVENGIYVITVGQSSYNYNPETYTLQVVNTYDCAEGSCGNNFIRYACITGSTTGGILYFPGIDDAEFESNASVNGIGGDIGFIVNITRIK